MQGCASILKTLATARHPAAKTSQHSPGKEPGSKRDRGTLSGPAPAQPLTRPSTPQKQPTKRARSTTALRSLRPGAPRTSARPCPRGGASAGSPPRAEHPRRGRAYSLQGACPRQQALEALRASRLQYIARLPSHSSHSPGGALPIASTHSAALPPQQESRLRHKSNGLPFEREPVTGYYILMRAPDHARKDACTGTSAIHIYSIPHQ